ncbi:hypothetical protein AJ80_08503 [Polytolypa hystricis UAMH7299]|uniref:DUF833 domain-containing protein n=1 Tax=Polytolypa hystricis (strain UAMH7299) TaxID=1447883 RepID=A0A2B7X6F5_POLH7|nr:hypothetical protein AJ80_08503 [Polytolypa hystricis UAMH7299]
MCIALISTAHPSYPLILIDNRDEFLHRPTAALDWWPSPKSHILGSRDMARTAHGTWLGVTRSGKIAVLTNYREASTSAAAIIGQRSRGQMVNGFLEATQDTTAREYVEQLVSSGDAQLAGGFSLACGDVKGPLAIVSNRVEGKNGITWIAGRKGETVGLSNTVFGDRSWPKILDGERLMKEAIEASVKIGESEDGLVDRLLGLLSTDTLPRLDEGGGLETYIDLLKESIFVPVIGDKEEEDLWKKRFQKHVHHHNRNNSHDSNGGGEEGKKIHHHHAGEEICSSRVHDKVDVIPPPSPREPPSHMYMSGVYGTQKQTVVLVHESGRLKYVERTLFDDDAKAIPIGEGDRVFEFMVERQGGGDGEGGEKVG